MLVRNCDEFPFRGFDQQQICDGGWWIEGHFEGLTGWCIGFEEDPERSDIETASLYDKLERVILPKYYSHPDAYAEVMRSTIALNGSFFNTQRMLAQYVLNAYYPRANASSISTLYDDVESESSVASKV